MRRLITLAAAITILTLPLSLPPPAWAQRATGCNPDAVPSGSTCIDRYEASVWHTTDPRLIRLIKMGRVTLARLTAAGATQLGLAAGDLAAAGCPDTGNGCVNVYAVSIPGVTPSRYLTWFQAAAAARNAGKRLPSNAEWQAAALGTPDTGGADDGATTCNTDSTFAVASTGSRSACVSDVGAFDMVGNVWEWVADWGSLAAACTNWSTGFGSDLSCIGGDAAGVATLPGALFRGGYFGLDTFAGVFAVDGFPPSVAIFDIGFRAAR